MTRNEIKQLLRSALQERLLEDLSSSDDKKSFLQLGVDSIVATELIELIRREIDPTLRVLAECVQELKTAPEGDAYTRERLDSMLDFLTTMSGLFEEILRMPMGALKGVGKLRGKVITLLGSDKKKVG